MMKISEQTIAFKPNHAFAAYSLPGTTDHVLIFSENKDSRPKTPEKPFFVVSPFDRSKRETTYIHGDHMLTNAQFIFHPEELCDMKATSYTKYIHQAESVISHIKAGQFEKVVLSRIMLTEKNTSDTFRFFTSLKHTYTDAFVFFYHIPERGCWSGATPEILVRKILDRLYTVALAGTQLDKGIPLDQVVWGQKEEDEQKIIEKFVQGRLRLEGLDFSKTRAVTVRAAQILHISSEFNITSPFEVMGLAYLLHPGPAICGVPQQESMTFIKQTEDHDRRDYCGFAGIVEENNAALYINLRSMQLFRDKNALYLGGGLTSGSLPEDEWIETEHKAQTLLTTLEKSYL